MSILNIRKKSGGQVALIVLLASAILLTLGLSVSKKATTDTRVDTDQELLKQAFNSAESGVDYYLATGGVGYSTPDNKSKAVVTSVNIGGGSSLASDGLVLTNNTFLFWLVGHDETSGDINGSFYNGNDLKITVDSGFNKALKVDYFYNDSGIKVIRSVYNFNSSTVTGASSFLSGVSEISITKIGTPYLIAVTPIGGSTNITLSGTGSQNFPSQGEEITSIGTAVGVNSQVKVVNRYKVPSFMLDAITAGGDIK